MAAMRKLFPKLRCALPLGCFARAQYCVNPTKVSYLSLRPNF